jgi:hypothetical protein
MVTINVKEKTKERFKRIKLEKQSQLKKEISEDKLINLMLDREKRT